MVKPRLSEGFNAREKVGLGNFQLCPEGEYKFLMNQQNYATDFIYLQTVKCNCSQARSYTKFFMLSVHQIFC